MLDATLTRRSDAALTDEQQAFVQAIRDFCDRELGDRTRDDDPHDDEVARQMAELGWYGLEIDERYGGSGGSFLDVTP
jgi:isovaleryl-CoA dehydrogenase